ncbi:hypothetical protein [uncultured Winogradskyella sp.]|uniref:hypothetical protein n=1 Tax=uncultured Winogradskyella sp. TaxID=395353 RepID=UPI002621E46F|nr:hypothetical protein [uncultured Winogradskyella sp.]
MSVPQESPEDLIVGTWVHENEPSNKWQFTSDGFCYWMDENNNVEDTFTYSISYTSPQCGYQVQTNENQFYYLKLIDQNNDEYCYDIGVGEATLSINYLGVSGYDLFNRE